MLKKMKVMTVVGTRPEIIRLSSVIKACDENFEHIFVHTNQNWDYTLNDIFIKEFKLREPDCKLNVVGENLGITMGNIIARSYELMKKVTPDVLLILGDTNSALCAISAKRLKIPIFHMEAGNRCFDQNVPEEINRRLIDHISDVNLPYTEHSRRNLLNEGLHAKYIFVTGSPMAEVLDRWKDEIEKDDVLNELDLVEKKYIVISIHREENLDIDEKLSKLTDTINGIATEFNVPIIFSTHPRTLSKIKAKNLIFDPLILNHEPFGYFAYIKLQMNALCVLSDSGTLSEESSILNFPSVLLRTSTERPEVLDNGSIVIGGITKKEVIDSIQMVINEGTDINECQIPSDYKDKHVSRKIIRLIQSYTSIINDDIWKKGR